MLTDVEKKIFCDEINDCGDTRSMIQKKDWHFQVSTQKITIIPNRPFPPQFLAAPSTTLAIQSLPDLRPREILPDRWPPLQLLSHRPSRSLRGLTRSEGGLQLLGGSSELSVLLRFYLERGARGNFEINDILQRWKGNHCNCMNIYVDVFMCFLRKIFEVKLPHLN